MAVACSELYLGGAWTGLHGGKDPTAEDLLGTVSPLGEGTQRWGLRV